MAHSGSFSSEIGSYYTFRVDWTSSPDAAANRSAVTFKLYLVGHNIASASTSIGKRSGNAMTVDGAGGTWDAAAVNETGNFTLLLGTKKVTVSHASDGSKSFRASFTYACKFTTDGAYRASVTAAANLTLDPIARASDFTLSPTSAEVGEEIGIRITRASEDFTHTLSYSLGTLSGTIAEKTALTEVSWTLPASLLAAFTDSAALSGVITCVTYSGNSEVGRKNASFTAKLPSSSAPVISAVTVVPAASPAGFEELYLRNISRASISVAASGETTLEYHVTVAGKTYDQAIFLSDVLTEPGETPWRVVVRDARGLQASLEGSFTVLPAGNPYLIPPEGEKEVVCRRADAAGNVTATGSYLLLRGGRTMFPLAGKNRAKVTWAYKLASEAAFSEAATLSPDNASRTVYFEAVLPLALTERAYVVRLTAEDHTGARQTVDIPVPQSLPTLNLRAGGLGAAFGKYASSDNLLESAWPIRAPGLTLEDALPLSSGGTGAMSADGALAAITGRESDHLAPGEEVMFHAPSPKSVFLIVCTDKNNPGAWLAGGGNNSGSSYVLTLAASSLMQVTSGGSASDEITLSGTSSQYNANYLLIRLA